MLKSMTGYGEASVETESFVLAIEIKCVNNRFLKIHSKISEEVFYLQNDLEEIVRQRLSRGSVYFTVRFEPTRYADLYEVDEDVLVKYREALERLAAKYGTGEEIRFRDLLLLPGVIHTHESLMVGSEEVKPVALDAMRRALDEVVRMRNDEGRHLEADLRARTKKLMDYLEKIKEASPRALDEYHERLQQRVRLLLGDQEALLSPEDVTRELAIFAERSDITEEVARMESHVNQLSESLESESPVGRKLEFIAQELLREANTMGAKSSSAQLNRHVVDLKAEVDRIKEQVLNIE